MENTSLLPNDSCSVSLEGAASWTRAIHAAVIASLVVVSLLGNGLVLLLVARYKQLQRRSVMVILCVAVADLVMTFSFHLPALVSTVIGQWPFTSTGCMAFGFLGFEFILTRWMIMAVLSIDRFFTVRFPFSYEKHSKSVLAVLIVAAWVLPIASVVPSVHRVGDILFRENIPTCLVGCSKLDMQCKVYVMSVLSLAFTVGGVLPTLLYLWLYHRARRLSGPSMMNRNIFETRVIVTFVIIFVSFLVTGFPAYSFFALRSVSEELFCKIPIFVHFVIADIFLSSTALDPIVIVRDKAFRKCIKDLCCPNRCRQSRWKLSIAGHVQSGMNSDITCDLLIANSVPVPASFEDKESSCV